MPAYLSGWDNRVKIAIDHTKIDADLTDFPVMIKISDDSGQGGADLTAIFDELTTDAERVKIAVTTSDGETQCPVEIEYWDVSSEIAILHTKVPAVDDDVSTAIYLYYDADAEDNTTYVGDTGDTPAQNVWDSDFGGVYHMAQDPNGDVADAIKDSTDTGADGTPSGTMLTADLVAAQCGKGIDFDGTNDTIILGNNLSATGSLTITALVKTTNVGLDYQGILAKISGTTCNYGFYLKADEVHFQFYNGGWITHTTVAENLSADTYYLVTVVLDTTANTIGLFVNDAEEYTSAETTELLTNAHDCYIGFDSGAEYFSGIIDQVYFSDIARSDAWIKATYHTLFDNLLSFGLGNGYLPGFKNRVQIDIDSDLIDADLTDFPVTLYLSDTAGISELDTDRVFEVIQSSADNKKIAVTTADGLTQCPVEIEYWNNTDKEAVLHVKVPHVESSADTTLYLYFDDSAADNDNFVGDIGDAVAQDVWDSDFAQVLHMNNATTLYNAVDGTTETMAGSLTLVDGPHGGKALQADADGDYIACASLAFTTTFTVESQHMVDSGGPSPGYDQLIGYEEKIGYTVGHTSDRDWQAYTGSGSAWDTPKPPDTTVLAEDTWHTLAFTYNAGVYSYFKEGVDDGGGSSTSRAVTTAYYVFDRQGAPGSNYHLHGRISEFRISTVERSDAWIKATCHTLLDTLVTFSNFQSSEFKKRRKITIDSDLIDATLTNFPLALPLGTSAGIGDEDLSDIFAELGSNDNRFKIKVTLDDLITECPVEIEHFDVATETGMLHTKIPSIAADEDTEIYLHYDCDQPDNANVGDPGDTIAQTVWDDDFESVHHLQGQGDGTSDEFKDSTSNANHGQADGGAGTIPTLGTSGPKGYSQDFDGGDWITFPITTILGAKSVEVLSGVTSGSPTFYDTGGASTVRHGTFFGSLSTKLRCVSANGSAPFRFDVMNGALDILDDVFRVYGHVWDGTTDANMAKGFVNGVEQCQGTAANTETASPSGITSMLGGFYYSGGSGYTPTLVGGISEVRVSSGVRSDAWLLATYHTLFDTLVTWGAVEGPWLGTWTYRRKFTISSALVDSALSDFPVTLLLNSSCGLGDADLTGIFSEIGDADRKKIAVTTGDKVTQCYVEIEHWDASGEKAVLHVKLPGIASDADTELFLYYDSDQDDNTSYVGDTGDAGAQNVWDSNFESVWHLVGQGDGTSDEFKDSTSNNNHGEASQGAGTIPTLEATGPKGYSQDFDGGDLLTFPISTILGAKSVEVLAAVNSGSGTFWDTGGAADVKHGTFFGTHPTGGKLRVLSGKGSAPYRFEFHNGASDITDSVFRIYSHVWDGTTDANMAKGFMNGVEECQGTAVATETTSPSGITTVLGGYYYDGGGDYNPNLDGNISEARVSSGVRSDAWLLATYHALFDTFGTWGAEEEEGAGPPPAEDIYAVLGAPAEITYSVPAALVGVSIDLAAPAEITYSAPGVVGIGFGVDVGPPPEITYSVPAVTIVQNLNAIGIMSKPNVSAKKPSATVTAKKPNATAVGSGPSVTVTAKGD
jgi:hypothetical protein